MSISYFSICLLALVVLAAGDGWGSVAAQGSADTSAGAAHPAAPPREPLAGGVNPIDLSDAEERKKIDDLGDFALQQINGQSNNLYRHTKIRVVKAEKQVVAGFLYTITFTSCQSSCRNTPENLAATAETCPISNDANAPCQQCTAKVLVQAWRHIKKLDDFSCAAADASVRTSA